MENAVGTNPGHPSNVMTTNKVNMAWGTLSKVKVFRFHSRSTISLPSLTNFPLKYKNAGGGGKSTKLFIEEEIEGGCIAIFQAKLLEVVSYV